MITPSNKHCSTRILCWAVLILLFFFPSIIASSWQSNLCPRNCVCRANNTILDVDCSNVGLTEIPIDDIPKNVTRLSLTGNRITSIENIRNTRWEQLQILDLRGNPISTIPIRIFKGLDNLTTLYINTYSMQPYPFDGLDLEFLWISGFRHAAMSPGMLYSIKPTLKEFHITNTKFEYLPDDVMTYLASLQVLNLTGNQFDGNFVSNMFTSGHKTLRKLILKENKINVIDCRCQSSFESLKILDLSCNQISVLSLDIPSCFPYMEMLNVSSNRLRNLPRRLGSHVKTIDLQRNALHTLPDGFISSLNDSLVRLDLSHNPWKIINTAEFEFTRNLTELRLHNLSSIRLDLTSIESWPYDTRVRGLTLLDLSYNTFLKSYKIPEEIAIANLIFTHSELTEFPLAQNIRHGKITKCDVSWNAIRTLVVKRPLGCLNASHNQIEKINISYVWTEIDNLDISHNNMTSTEDIFIGSNTFLRNVNFTFNRIENLTSFYKVPPGISGRFAYKIHPIRMDFSYNRIKSIDKLAFSNIQPLVSLKLNNNRLKSIPWNVFKDQLRLMKLDLSGNRFTEHLFDNGTFVKSIRYMVILLLASNNMTHVTRLNQRTFKYLQLLDLSSNPIDYLPEQFMILNRRLKQISIYNASFECTCKVIDVIAKTKAKSRRNLQIEGNCLDSSTGEPQLLGDMLQVIKSNNLLCNNSYQCQTMKCVSIDKCLNSNVDFNCHCFEPSPLSNHTEFFTIPLYQNPIGTPSRNESQNRWLIFCKEPSCLDDDIIRKSHSYTTVYNSHGQCRWNLNKKKSNSTNTSTIQCSKVPILTDLFCKIDRKNADNRPIHAGLVFGLIVGGLFVVIVVSMVVHKLRSINTRSDAFSDLALTDFDYLDENSVKDY